MTMIEKIARAVQEAGPKSCIRALSVQDATGIARAALLAVRDPSWEMIDAGEQEQGDCMGYERKAATSTFTAMIDAILKEGGE